MIVISTQRKEVHRIQHLRITIQNHQKRTQLIHILVHRGVHRPRVHYPRVIPQDPQQRERVLDRNQNQNLQNQKEANRK